MGLDHSVRVTYHGRPVHDQDAEPRPIVEQSAEWWRTQAYYLECALLFIATRSECTNPTCDAGRVAHDAISHFEGEVAGG